MKTNKILIAVNGDNGSIKTEGRLPGLKVGDQLEIVGEGGKKRTVTYLMGQNHKEHACCKGSGPVPMGAIEVIHHPAEEKKVEAEVEKAA